jgi:DMSO/TMAO reductase YedYZ molybdopterin-dependent catalytic subunit
LDKYKSSLLLEDALADDVLLADKLDAQPLSFEHGAPLRIVAPAHYGYKNVKHLSNIELLQDATSYKPRIPRFMEHPRARIAYEERGRYFPGWLLRYLYRPLIEGTVRKMKTG